MEGQSRAVWGVTLSDLKQLSLAIRIPLATSLLETEDRGTSYGCRASYGRETIMASLENDFDQLDVVDNVEDYMSDDDEKENTPTTTDEEEPNPWRTGKHNVGMIMNTEATLKTTIKMQNRATRDRERKILNFDYALRDKVFSILKTVNANCDMSNLYVHDIRGNYVMVRVHPQFNVKIAGGVPYVNMRTAVNMFNGAIINIVDDFVLLDEVTQIVRGYASKAKYENDELTITTGAGTEVINTKNAVFTRYDDSPVIRIWKHDGEIHFSTSYSIDGKNEKTHPEWQLSPTTLYEEFKPYEVAITSLFNKVETGYIHMFLRTKKLCSDRNELEYGPVLITSSLPKESLISFGLWKEETPINPEKLADVFDQNTIVMNNSQFDEPDYSAVSVKIGSFGRIVIRSWAYLYRQRVIPTSKFFTVRLFELSNVRFLSDAEYKQRWPVLLDSISTPEDKIKNLIAVIRQICPASYLEDLDQFYEKYFGEDPSDVMHGIVKKLPKFMADRYMKSTTGHLKPEKYEIDIYNRSRTYATGDMEENIRLAFECNNPEKAHVDGNELYKAVKKYVSVQQLIAKHAAKSG